MKGGTVEPRYIKLLSFTSRYLELNHIQLDKFLSVITIRYFDIPAILKYFSFPKQVRDNAIQLQQQAKVELISKWSRQKHFDSNHLLCRQKITNCCITK